MTEQTLTPEQEKKWEDTMSLMAWTAPGFRHLFYTLLNAQADGHTHAAMIDPACGIAATDSKYIYINPEEFFKFKPQGRVYVMGHEVLHNVYGDVELLKLCVAANQVPMNDGTHMPFDMDVMQRSMDYRINALLTESKIGVAPEIGNYSDKHTSQDSVLDIYGYEYKKKFENNEEEPDPQGKDNPGGFDNVQQPKAGQPQRNDQQWAVEMATAQTLEMARKQGDMAAGLQRLFKEILEPEVPWIDHIQTLINRAVGEGGYDWTRPDPWIAPLDVFSPTPTGTGAGWIVVWGDTSGSRSDKELASNIAELASIMDDIQPERLTVLWCDANIDYVDEITDPMDLAAVIARGTGGGGGTSMQPVMDWIASNRDGTPDLMIAFTDGYVDFPKEPEFPVIWASSTDMKYPYGAVVRVNKGH